MDLTIAEIRREYQMAVLSEDNVASDPMSQFADWWKEAVNSQIDEVNAMTLATASADGIPAARIVLLKGMDAQRFSFFSNYESYKGKQLEENPRACLVFFWKELERQVRVTGIVRKLNAEESDAYYLSRPEGSRIGAWASPQSQVIESRNWLENRVAQFSTEFQTNPNKRPEHWGGYAVYPITVEFWQGRPSRLHARIQYTLTGDGSWIIERLAP